MRLLNSGGGSGVDLIAADNIGMANSRADDADNDFGISRFIEFNFFNPERAVLFVDDCSTCFHNFIADNFFYLTRPSPWKLPLEERCRYPICAIEKNSVDMNFLGAELPNDLYVLVLSFRVRQLDECSIA
jgi:hypothetical protein